MQEESRPVDLVFEGGGVKGIGLAGALAVLEEHGFEPQDVAGASAGAILAVLVAAGYSGVEIRDILLDLDFGRFRDKGWEDRLPLVSPSLSLLLDLGIYEGEALRVWLTELLQARGVTKFGDLSGPRPHVLVSDLTKRDLLVLPDDAHKLGVVPDEFDVAAAVRMSMSIPLFFEPVRFRNPETGEEHLLVDGGLLSNFPVWLFDCEGRPERPTFGLLLVEPWPRMQMAERLPGTSVPARGPRALVDYGRAVVQTMLEARDRLYVENADLARTITIPTLGIGTTEFDLSSERAQTLYDSGRRAARSFVEGWDFETYIAEFRSDVRPVGRRSLLARAAGAKLL